MILKEALQVLNKESSVIIQEKFKETVTGFWGQDKDVVTTREIQGLILIKDALENLREGLLNRKVELIDIEPFKKYFVITVEYLGWNK